MYLITPYNAYQKPPKKKHWHEIIEEEDLFHRMMQEAKNLQMTQNDSVQNGPSCATVGDAGTGTGAGGAPDYLVFHPELEVDNFSADVTSGAAPLVVHFTPIVTTPVADKYLWLFGDGTTSHAANPTHSFANTQSYNVTLQITNSYGQAKATTKVGYITASLPVITPNFSVNSASGAAPFTASFTNTTTYNGSGTLTYKWVFGDGATTASLNAAHVYQTGSFVVELQVTESSFSVAQKKVLVGGITASLPTITADFTGNVLTGSAPLAVTFSNATTYTGPIAPSIHSWTFGDGGSSSLASPSHLYNVTGSFTVVLRETGSFGVSSVKTRTNYISASA